MNDDVKDRLRMWLRGPIRWLLPALAAHALVLIGSPRVWVDTVVSTSRSGRASETVVAHLDLIALGACTALFAATYVLGGVVATGRWGMRSPTDAEQGCALAMVRAVLLLAIYGAAFVLLRTYVF